MRIHSLSRLSLIALISLAFFSCNEKEELVSEPLSDYMPLTVGKYITYRMDSTVFTNFGTVTEVHKYQVKHQVDALLSDNQGRPIYRIYRYIRDSAGTQPWQPLNSSTYYITPLSDQVESSEDNLRVIKLHLPIKDGFAWKGNKYLPTSTCATTSGTYCQLYGFSNDDNMADWDFSYQGSPSPFSYKGVNYTNVITVEKIDEVFNVPITSPNIIAYKSRAVDKYSKGIGLIYQEYTLWEYQPPGTPSPGTSGFGITMWMIDHN